MKLKLLFFSALLFAFCFGSKAQYATSGTGYYKSDIFWLKWDATKLAAFNGTPGTDVITFNSADGLPAGMIIKLSLTAKNATNGSLYTSGGWGGDSFDDMFGGLTNNAIKVSSATITRSFDILITFKGDTVPSNLIFADAEDCNNGENIKLTRDGTLGWYFLEGWDRKPSAGQDYTATISGTNSETALTTSTDGTTGSGMSVLMAPSISKVDISYKGSGTSAISLGFLLPYDYSDAQSYIVANHSQIQNLTNTKLANGTYGVGDTNDGLFSPAVNPAGYWPIASLAPTLYFGSILDTEKSATLNATATGDNITGVDDEEGISTLSTIDPRNATYTLSATVYNKSGTFAYVYAWIDFNGDGDFDDTEMMGTGTPIKTASSGVPKTLSFTWDLTAFKCSDGTLTLGNKILRIRICNDILDDFQATYDERSVGSGFNGEVEDYQVVVSLPPPTTGSNSPICPGNTINLTASTVASTTYTWSGPNSFASTLQNPSITSATTAMSGTYSVQSVYVGCLSVAATTNVTVNPTPTLNSSLTSSRCNNVSATYTPTSAVAGTTFTWTRAAEAGITNTSASGSGAVTETLVNSTSAPVDIIYVYSLTANSCPNTQNVTVTVNPTPVLSSSLTASRCSNVSTTYTAASATTGTTFSWTRAVVAGISNAAGSAATAAATETLINTSTAPVNVTYIYTLTANSCNNTQNVVVTVNPSPVLSSTLTPAAICSGTTFGYNATSATAGTTFAWTRAVVAGISNAAGSGTGDVSETLTNTSTAPVVVTYVYTTSANTCTGSPQNVTVTVNPSPKLSSTLTPAAICSATTFGYTATSATTGATFAWTRAVVAGISNAAGSGTTTISEALTNTSTAPVVVTYVYTTTANTCAGTPQNVTVTVNPTPVLSSSLTASRCSNVSTTYTATSAITGTAFSWTRAVVAGISNAAGSAATAAATETLINTSTAPVNVTYIYTLTANSCNNTQNVVVTVNPSPVLSSTLTPAAICSGTTFGYNATSATAGTTFAWTRAVVAGISNAAGSGTGDVSETLTNTSTAPVVVTYVYTTSANTCTGSPQNVIVTVNPSPKLSSTLTPAAICSAATFGYTATSATAGATFAWTRAVVAGISNAAGSGTGDVSETLTNTSTAPIVVTYVYTTTANTCVGTPQNVTITVNPTPVLNSSLTASRCSNVSTTYTATSAITGTTFSWTRAVVAGISNAAGSAATAAATETLINTSTAPVNVTYIYTLTANSCNNTQNVVVTVNPSPVLSSTLTPAAICSGTTFGYNATSATAGTTFAWTRAVVAGISNAAGSGTGDVSETLTNTSTAPVVVTYVYTTSANTCTGSPQNVTVTVNPSPKLSSTLTPAAICSATTFGYTATSATTGATFAWTRAVVAGISNAAGSGTTTISEALTNTSTAPVVVTYVYTTTANTCAGTPQNVTVTVNPTPVLSSSLTASRCSNVSTTYTATSAITGTTFSWTRAVVAGISNAAGSAATAAATETLVNTSTAPVNVTYIYTLTANSCNNTQNVVVTVNPSPVLSSTLTPAAICSGTTFGYNATSATAGATFAWTRAVVAGISNAAGSGTGNVSETLTNTSTAPVVVTYVYTTSANTCTGSPQNVTVTVNPTPLLNSSLTASRCSNVSATYTATSTTAGTTFSWTRAAVGGISNAASSGATAAATETLINTSTAPVNVTYIYTLTANSCNNNQNVVITVNPSPVLSSTLTPAAVCSGTTFGYTATSATTGASFAWTRAAVAGISNAAGSGTGNVSEILTNTTTAPKVVTYVYTTTANTCAGSPQNVTVTVNPTPLLTSILTPSAICSSANFSYTATSATTGATFTWTRAVVAGISNAAGSGSGNISETLTNTSTAPVVVTYIYTTTANSCPKNQNVTVTVNPTPVLSSSLTGSRCNNVSTTYTATSATTGTTFSWTRAVVTGISNAAGSGATASATETLINTTTAPVNVTYVYTLAANTCTNTQNVVITVNPTPVLSSSLTPPGICSGSAFNYTVTSSTSGATFTWTRAVVGGISNAAGSGSGNISETLTNTSANPVSVTYVYTTTANTCSNTQNVIVSVNPSPALSSTLTPAAICGGTVFSYTPTSTTAGAAFSWTRATVAGISNAAGSGTGVISETLTNTTVAAVSVVYVYTTSLNSCNGNPQNVTVSVGPVPNISGSAFTNPTTCAGANGTITLSGFVTGTSYKVNFSKNSLVQPTTTLIANASGNVVLTALSDGSYSNFSVSFTASGCASTVFAGPVVLSDPGAPASPIATSNSPLCPGNTINLFANTIIGATYNWTGPLGYSSTAQNPTIAAATVAMSGTYQVTATLAGCTSPVGSTVVTVNPSPSLSSTLAPTGICSGTTFNYTATSATSGATFTWSRAAVAGISNAAGSGNGDVSETLINTTASPINVTYVYTTTANGCAGSPQNVIVSVSPIPVLNSTLTPAAICSGATFSYIATSATPGAAFSWNRAIIAGISNTAGSGNGNISEILTNTTSAPISVTYVYSTTANSCSGSSQNVVLTVNPSPLLSSSLTNTPICSNTAFTYTPASTTTGATFAWTRAAVAGISNAAAGNNGSVNETLINTSISPVVVTYVYTVSANGCSGPPQNVTVTVNPNPVLNTSLTAPPVCSGNVNYIAVSATSGTTFTWTRAVVAGISNAAGSGTGDVNETLISTSTAPVVVTYLYTSAANGCSGSTQTVTITINPTPSLSSTLTPSPVCSGSTFTYTATSATAGATFDWTRPVVAGITNPVGSGTGNVSETLTNSTVNPVVVTYIYITTANGCAGNPESVTLTVNPTPLLNSTLAPSPVCSGTPFSYTVTSSTTGSVFTWTRAAVTGISNPAGSGSGNINETLINTNTAPVNVTYAYTVTANSCPNNQNVTVTVNPSPVLSSTLNPAPVCNNSSFTYTATSGTAGTLFTWSRAVVAGISNAAGSGNGNINETLINTSTDPVSVVYAYTLNANGCSNTQNVTLIVNPSPVLTSTLTPPDVCSGSPFIYTATSSTAGATFAWSRSVTAGISNAAGSGSGNINETLINTSVNPVVVSYLYTTSANTCSGSVQSVTVTINPTPKLSSTLTPAAICSGSTFNYAATSATTGATFNWTRASVAGISNAAGSGTGDVSEVLTSTATANVIITYVYTTSANGCPGNTQNVTVTVNPTPVLNSTLTPAPICSGNTFNYNPTSATAGTGFIWIRAAVAGISNAAGSGIGPISEALVNTTADPVDVVYEYTLTATTCPNVQNVTITIKPIPVLSSLLNGGDICSGTVFAYNATSATTGATFSWTRAVVVGISNPAGSGTGDINETLTNTTTSPIVVTYIYTLTSTGCAGATQSVTVNVNPSPKLNSSLTPPAICSGTTFVYSATSATAGATFTWSRAAVAGISNAPASGSGDISEILINTNTAPVSVVYVYITDANTCSGSPQNVTVVVNPDPVISSTTTPAAICSGATFAYTAISATAGSSFAWTRPAVTGISNAAGSGNGNVSEALINTTTYPVDVVYTYITTANTCAGTPVDVTVTVKPTPVLSSTQTPSNVCSGSTFSYTPSSATSGVGFIWARVIVASIMNPAKSGNGTINETLINTSANPVTVTYVYSLTASACSNTQSISVVIDPTPILSSTLTPPAVCSNTPFTYTATSATAGSAFSWTRASVAGISNPADNGTGDINETLINTTTNPINVSYAYAIIANGCSNSQTVTVTVNPTPVLNSTFTPAPICNNTLFTYTASSLTSGSGFTWVRPVVTGISNTAGSGNGNIVETLINTTTDPVTVTYIYTVTANTCPGDPQNVMVIVNPEPVLNSPLTSPDICSGSTYSYITGSATSGASFAWSRAAVTNISNPAASGTGTINESLINTSTAPVVVTYSYTTSANGCGGTPQNVTVTVNPTPLLSSTLTPPAICNAITFSYTATSATSGASFTWTRAATSGISEAGNNGTGDINEVLTNVATDPIAVTYIYTTTANACPNSENVIVTVNPDPILNSPLTASQVCSGSLFNYAATSATTGASFGWTRAAVTGISNAASSGSGDVNETLINPTTDPIIVDYIYTTTANSCVGSTPQTVTVTINPIPILSSSLTPPNICSDESFSYLATSATATAGFSWTRPFVAGISNAATTGFGDVNEILTNTTSGTIAVTYQYVSIANGCSDAAENVIVNVKPTPATPTVTSNSPLCFGDNINLQSSTVTATSTYNWTGPLGYTATGQTQNIPSATTFMSGTYFVTATDLGCTSAAGSVDVTVNPTPPTPIATSNSPVCTGNTINLSSNLLSGATWTGPNGFTSTDVSPSIPSATAAMAGTYSVISNVLGCTSVQGTVDVIINPDPVVTDGTKTCPTGTAILTASYGSSGTFRWYDSATGGTLLQTSAGVSTSTYTTPILNITTTYYVEFDNGSCTGNRIAVNAIATGIGCPPVAFNDLGETETPVPVTLQVTINDTDIDGTIDVATVDLDPATPGIQTTFTVTGQGTFIVNNTGLVTFTPLITYHGLVTITYTINDNSGMISNTGTITINVIDNAIRIPEGFSPNADGINDNFVIHYVGPEPISLDVFNRWGNLVYKNGDYKNDWNGIDNKGVHTGHDSEVPDGTYFYIIKIGEFNQSGYITIHTGTN